MGASSLESRTLCMSEACSEAQQLTARPCKSPLCCTGRHANAGTLQGGSLHLSRHWNRQGASGCKAATQMGIRNRRLIAEASRSALPTSSPAVNRQGSQLARGPDRHTLWRQARCHTPLFYPPSNRSSNPLKVGRPQTHGEKTCCGGGLSRFSGETLVAARRSLVDPSDCAARLHADQVDGVGSVR